jgi:hypothetical protein
MSQLRYIGNIPWLLRASNAMQRNAGHVGKIGMVELPSMSRS